MAIWGIDLGGTKIEGVILEDKENLNVLKRIRVQTGGEKGYKHVIGQISKLVEVLTAETGLRPEYIGIGTPGIADPYTNLMKNCNTTALNGMPLQEDIEKALGISVKIANDANCFAVAEAHFGAVKEQLGKSNVVFGVIMGTGVGGGLVVDGKIIAGRQGIAGEWGHNFLDASGGVCYCGKTGCVETIIAGPSLEKYYKSLTGVPKKLKDIAALYKEGKDEAATQTMKRLTTYFGKAIAYIVNIVDPDAIVIGGGVGNIDLLYTEGVKEARKHVFNDQMETVFLKPKLGDSAGVFGAALL